MTNKRRILIIENQFIQFKEIIKLLDSAGYQSFPDQNSFRAYLDAIKIYLNPRYSYDRRTLFLNKLLDMTTQFNPEILIIDHILVGTHDAQDGIDLAVMFREKGLKQPIIFFSRTELNNIDICDKLPKVSLIKEWIFKGYSGAEILEEKFFQEMVIPKIESLLNKSITERTLERLTQKKPKMTSVPDETIDKIILKTEALAKEITENKIALTEELLSKLRDDLSDAIYLKLLNEEFLPNELVS